MRLTKYIANLKFTDTWKETTTQFYVHFKEQLRLWDSLVSPSENIPDFTKLIFLQQGVEAILDLRRLRIADHPLGTKEALTTTLI